MDSRWVPLGWDNMAYVTAVQTTNIQTGSIVDPINIIGYYD